MKVTAPTTIIAFGFKQKRKLGKQKPRRLCGPCLPYPSFYPVPYCLPSLRFLLNCFLFIPLSSLFSFLSSIFSNPSLYLIYFPSSPTNLLFQPYLLYFYPPILPYHPLLSFPVLSCFLYTPFSFPLISFLLITMRNKHFAIISIY